jgi:non-canonical (house-cleaning) NTP pyrophosphatase
MLLRHVSAILDIDTAILSKIERAKEKHKEQINKLSEILEINKDALIVHYLSEKILYQLKDET